MIVISRAKLQINVWMFVSRWKWESGIKNGPLPFPAVLWVASVREKTLIEKNKKIKLQYPRQRNIFLIAYLILLICLHFQQNSSFFQLRSKISKIPRQKHTYEHLFLQKSCHWMLFSIEVLVAFQNSVSFP